MKIKELMEMSTTAGAIATGPARPMGETQKRVKVAGLEPAEKVMSGKTKKKGPYANSLSESRIKQLLDDLKELSDKEFLAKYKKTKAEFKKKLSEADLSRRGFLGTLGKAAAAGAAASAGGQAMARQSLGYISIDDASDQIMDLKKQAYKDLSSLVWNKFAKIVDKSFGGNTSEDSPATPEEIGRLLGYDLAQYAKDFREKVKNIKIAAGVKDPLYLNKTWAPATINENELIEQDLIIVPGQKIKRKTGFVQNGQSRVDHEVEMARSDVLATMKNAKSLYMLLKHRSEDEGLEGWVQEKLIKANDYLNAVKEYYDEKMMQEMTGGVIAAGGVGESANLSEKFASKQQAKLMYAAAGDKGVAKKTGVSQKVAKEFIKKSHGQKVSKLPKKVEKK